MTAMYCTEGIHDKTDIMLPLPNDSTAWIRVLNALFGQIHTYREILTNNQPLISPDGREQHSSRSLVEQCQIHCPKPLVCMLSIFSCFHLSSATSQQCFIYMQIRLYTITIAKTGHEVQYEKNVRESNTCTRKCINAQTRTHSTMFIISFHTLLSL